VQSAPYAHEALREEQYDEIHFSPHMDDSAYSCAGRILQRRREGARVLVITVFGDGKSAPDLGDRGTFSNYAQRLEEELAVMRSLDVDYIWLNYPELLFRKHRISDLLRYLFPFTRLASVAHDELFARALALVTRRLAPGGTVFFPFAVGFHPDHRVLFDVGRALHALGRFQVAFYEDVPYSTVPALRGLRLRALNMPAPIALLRGTSELNQFLFRNFGALRLVTWLPLWFYLLSLLSLRALSGAVDKLTGEPDPELSVRDIGDSIAGKADAMRLYPTQTAFFLTLGPELIDMIKHEGRAEELVWTFPPFASGEARLSAQQKACAARL
jgi:LmbE family N-acetylglucosaminyl deacetylase